MAVRGHNNATAPGGVAVAVEAVTHHASGRAIYAYADGGANAWGLWVEAGKAHFAGAATFHGGHADGDLAENRPARGGEAGDVVVIGPEGVLVKGSRPQDSAVAGIISTRPTMSVGGLEAGGNAAPLALVGVVPCKVDATDRPIKPGDLLVSASTPGHAMRAPNDHPKAGTVIGKALEALESGKGVIQVLVTLR